MSVFPQILVERWKLVQQAKLRRTVPNEDIPKLSVIINNTDWSKSTHILFCTCPYPNSEIASDALYLFCTNKEVRKVSLWCTKRIMTNITVDNYLSIEVYIRIATSMLNKLNIPKEINIYYHDNLVANVSSLLSELNTEDLPF